MITAFVRKTRSSTTEVKVKNRANICPQLLTNLLYTEERVTSDQDRVKESNDFIIFIFISCPDRGILGTDV